ncbi:methyltransferase domain-containing protein [Actinocorallia lasiicapitis]
MEWQKAALRLSEQVTLPGSVWRPAIAAVPRHVFVPTWWEPTAEGWARREGAADEAAWRDAAYAARRSLVTQMSGQHADTTPDGTLLKVGRPTSSASMPVVLIQMYRHMAADRAGLKGLDVLDLGTGSGYGAALLATVFGDDHVVSVDVDPGLVTVAAERLREARLHPEVLAVDGLDDLPGSFDLLVATFSVPGIPESWLRMLRPGGRFVTTLANTSIILTGNRIEDGGAVGWVERDWAGFMTARRQPGDYPAVVLADDHAVKTFLDAWDGAPSTSSLPVVSLDDAWELATMLALEIPGIEWHYLDRDATDGRRSLILAHPDGSWSVGHTETGRRETRIIAGGPQNLWHTLDELRWRWIGDGSLPWRGAAATITPDGRLTLRRGSWTHTIPPVTDQEGPR